MLSVILILLTPILALAALTVRFARNAAVLNSVDYSTVQDRSALHRWAGNRLMVLPILSGTVAWGSLQNSMLGFVGGVALFIAFKVVMIVVYSGIDKF